MAQSDKNSLVQLVKFAAFAVTVAAIVKEFRTPRGERAWHGAIGPVPYDFRRPTLDRVRSRLWAPDASLVQPQPFGVGWTINVGRLLKRS